MDTPQITPKTNPGENSDNSSNDDRGIGHQALTQYGGGTTQLTVGNQVSTFKEYFDNLKKKSALGGNVQE